jgi:hypothetical protein
MKELAMNGRFYGRLFIYSQFILRIGVNTRTGSFDLLRTTGMNAKNHPDDQVGVPVLVGYCVFDSVINPVINNPPTGY